MRTVEINHDIYSAETVERTMAAYEGLAEMTVRHGEERSTVTFRNCRADEGRTVREFENYMIGIENS